MLPTWFDETAIGASLLSLVIWIVRRLFTNQKEIELLSVKLNELTTLHVKEIKDAVNREQDARLDETRELRALNIQLLNTIAELKKKG